MKNLYLLAQDPGSGGVGRGTKIVNPFLKDSALENFSGLEFIEKFIPATIGLVLVAGLTFFVFMFLWGAISWILSGGDKGGVESARSRITNSLVGVVLLLSTFAVIKLVEFFFGIDILSIDIGPLVIQ